MNSTITTKGQPRKHQRYRRYGDYSECAQPLKTLLAAGFNQSETAFELSRRGVRTPGGSPIWNHTTVRYAAAALGLSMNRSC